ncbi:hypothetical protein GOA63_15145 [Sinorhizobium meliloti]|uniref:hypothetical protein n=1 Tax=Rhizobium meliloti TaxID=382 RepID=UPI001297FC95|nr:hypothetical protein [Sinorhizobium meliloti]MDW9593543.1 hypothetical protein [Sinorhizobium meliloti]MDX0191709.1 hypothetical protein [Sinorhizobium meliloti]MQV09065.1 hypothetical protein [Sinorhizobium meliloti]
MSAFEEYPQPNARRLRIFSFDPALAARYDLADMSAVTIDVRWENDLKPGPIGEYLEVVDVDPGSRTAYPPVDLNAPNLLAADGLAPSESSPRFHQQMVYAVAMKTIEHFERALGRKALWSSRRYTTGERYIEQYVPRLRIYPHALRQQNAYYSPSKKAVLFGYFPARAADRRSTPGSTVFTCLSHDIIAHETTHALLDGVHPRFNEPVNEDVLAFHEAFADIVALFQHFSYPGALRDQIARTRGDLARESVLGQLAQQFAVASGRGDALRSYLGKKDAAGNWRPAAPDAALLAETAKPHDRGAILVAAVFGAFAKVYRARTRDLFRIASEGTGVLREGDIHPDLVNRLAEEAQRCAERALQMCIRAIDYCPPVGITFGDYLRAVVTADFDMTPSDRENWRLAFIESFREWGISPRGIRSMAEDSLLWPTEGEVERRIEVEARSNAPNIPTETLAADATRRRETFKTIFQQAAPIHGSDDEYAQKASRFPAAQSYGQMSDVLTPVALSMERYDIWLSAEKQAAMFHSWLMDESLTWLAEVLGLVVHTQDLPKTISARRKDPARANIEIHSVRTALKRGPLGLPEPHMIVVVTQWRAGFFDIGKQRAMDQTPDGWADPKRDFKYRAGCTLLMDPEQMKLRRVIRTPGTVADEDELQRMRRYLLRGLTPPNAFDGATKRLGDAEPFAFLHSHVG